MGLILSLIIGGLAGWGAGKLMKGRDFGVVGNVLLGLVGGFLGNIVFGFVGLAATNILGTIVVSTLGAALLIYVARKLIK